MRSWMSILILRVGIILSSTMMMMMKRTIPLQSHPTIADFLNMRDEHLSTIPKMEPDKLIKSSIENLVPNPGESEDLSNIGRECNVPVGDILQLFLILPLMLMTIIPLNLCLIKILRIISSPKIDSLLEEFSGKLTHIDLVSSGINKADFDPEEEISLVEKLLYDNSSPRPPKEPNFENSNAVIESFSPSPIPVEGSDSLMEETDIFLAPDDSIPPGIENDDYDSKGISFSLKKFLAMIPLHFLKISHFILMFHHPLVLLRNRQMMEFTLSPELKCKALADLGASINLMPLSVWKKLGLPDLIPTRMTLELANRAICTPDGIARDVFVPVGKFTFLADFVIVDYESDPRVPLILGRPFLRTAHALIDVHGEEMILRDGDERLTLNMKHDTAIYSNHPHRESVNLINIFNVSSEDCLEVSVSNPTSGNPTFSLHQEITSSEVTHEIHDSEGCNFLSEELPDIDSFNDIHPYFDDNPLSGSTTYSSNSLLEEFTDELALITYPPDYDDNLQFDIESDLKEIEFLLYQGEKIKESKLLIDELDLPCDFLPYFEYDSFNSQHFSRDDYLPSPDNEDKKKKLAISKASLVFEDFDPLFYEPLVFKDVPKSMMLLPFSSENEEKVFKPGIYTFEKKEYSSLGCSSVPFLSPLISSGMGEFGPAHRPKTSASWEAPHAY
nr:reverse transcriptase domain-containing protein [Tanacetum cinerariifolium]